ncbi:MAG: hypothetical protein ACI86H_001544 [bacterium]|jgi:hypothetical protein
MVSNWEFKTTQNFDKIDFHDSVIEEITFNDLAITLKVDLCNILQNHPKNPFSEARCCSPCVLTIQGVQESNPLLFSEKEHNFSPHPFPQSPLDGEIMEATGKIQEDGLHKFHYSGWHKAGWTEWVIIAESFELEWKEMEKHAWFVGL